MPRPGPSGGATSPSTGIESPPTDDVVDEVHVHAVGGERAVRHGAAAWIIAAQPTPSSVPGVHADVDADREQIRSSCSVGAHPAPVPEVAQHDVDGARCVAPGQNSSNWVTHMLVGSGVRDTCLRTGAMASVPQHGSS